MHAQRENENARHVHARLEAVCVLTCINKFLLQVVWRAQKIAPRFAALVGIQRDLLDIEHFVCDCLVVAYIPV